MKQWIGRGILIEQRGACWRVLDGREVIVIVRGRNAAYEAATRHYRRKNDAASAMRCPGRPRNKRSA